MEWREVRDIQIHKVSDSEIKTCSQDRTPQLRV